MCGVNNYGAKKKLKRCQDCSAASIWPRAIFRNPIEDGGPENEAQPPNTLVTKDGLILKVLERNQGQKWLAY